MASKQNEVVCSEKSFSRLHVVEKEIGKFDVGWLVLISKEWDFWLVNAAAVDGRRQGFMSDIEDGGEVIFRRYDDDFARLQYRLYIYRENFPFEEYFGKIPLGNPPQ